MWTLNDIVRLLNKHHQRATYGAVAGVLDVAARGVMTGRTPCHQDSWVVAKTTSRKTGSRRGWPTGYANAQIHADCLRQIQHNPAILIDDPDDLEQWLTTHP
jgi:hypothetical protein